MTNTIDMLAGALAGGGRDWQVVDLTWPLSTATPTIKLPPPKVSPPPFSLHEISRYDDRGEHEYHNYFTCPEHGGTHVDSPRHWHTGRDLDDISAISLDRLIGPAVVMDCTDAAWADPDHLVTVEDVERFTEDHGPIPSGAWFILRTGWGRRYSDAEQFLNLDADGRPHWPGLDPDCAVWLAGRDILGFGVDTVGTDAGISGGWDPAHPVHHFVHQAGKCGMSSLANLDLLPPTGAIVVPAPLRILGGSAAPARVFALVPSATTED
jgi:kynurenine formamidase